MSKLPISDPLPVKYRIYRENRIESRQKQPGG